MNPICQSTISKQVPGMGQLWASEPRQRQGIRQASNIEHMGPGSMRQCQQQHHSCASGTPHAGWWSSPHILGGLESLPSPSFASTLILPRKQSMLGPAQPSLLKSCFSSSTTSLTLTWLWESLMQFFGDLWGVGWSTPWWWKMKAVWGEISKAHPP